MDKETFQELIEKINNGSATTEEVALYNYYYNEYQKIEGEDWDYSNLGEEKFLEDELKNRIKKNLSIKDSRKKYPLSYFKVAASLLIALTFSLLYLSKTKKLEKQEEENKIVNDINPAQNKAVLILSDGSKVDLDSTHVGVLAHQGNSNIEKASDGSIVYKPNPNEEAEKTIKFNTLSIPKGGKYKIVLSDGTKVWLNASSTLKYPAAFANNQRLVELEGEAYFEVAKNKEAPFFVKTKNQEIEVLGTHFNVNAYKDEVFTKTTLLEGSVKISHSEFALEKVLKIGQQSEILESKKGILIVDNADLEEVMAWKNELFYFNNTDLTSIMKQLIRWYDIDVDISNMPKKHFNGVLSRNVKLSKVLEMMEKTSGLKFKVEGRRVFMQE